jgi:hypothetical protein
MKEDVIQEDYEATILINRETLKSVLTGNISNPPRGVKRVLDMVRHLNPKLDKIIVGGPENKIEGSTLYIKLDLYLILTTIYREEGRDRATRVRNRVAPFLEESYSLVSTEATTIRDYSILLQEAIANRKISQSDIVALTSQLETGENTEIVITKQINKQAQWLLDAMQTIVDDDNLTRTKAQTLGSEIFGFSKLSISGPEDLMEKILTKYGQHIIFGVPALLNTNKYVISARGHSRSQFDILLINYLSDIEIVELKRPDEFLLDYDSGRGKFYPSKSLSIAAAQSERYISALYREHDTDLKIGDLTIREYLEQELGGTITLSICRPKAIIVIGTIQRIVKPYDELSPSIKSGVSKLDYEKNASDAYKEMKSAYQNIDIVTYTELIEGARLRLQLSERGIE